MQKVEISVTWLNGHVTRKEVSKKQLLKSLKDVRH